MVLYCIKGFNNVVTAFIEFEKEEGKKKTSYSILVVLGLVKLSLELEP